MNYFEIYCVDNINNYGTILKLPSNLKNYISNNYKITNSYKSYNYFYRNLKLSIINNIKSFYIINENKLFNYNNFLIVNKYDSILEPSKFPIITNYNYTSEQSIIVYNHNILLITENNIEYLCIISNDESFVKKLLNNLNY